MRLVIYVLTAWFLVSIPVALLLGRVFRLGSDSCVGESDGGTDLTAIRGTGTRPRVADRWLDKSNEWHSSEPAA